MSRSGDSCIYYRMKTRAGGCNFFTCKSKRDEFEPPSRPSPGVSLKGDSPNGESD